jgi:hypothetical protein
MFQVQAPVLILPTLEAQAALGERIGAVGLIAWREIVLAADGVETGHLEFVFGRLTLAVCSRVRHDVRVEIEIEIEIEIAIGAPRLPTGAITTEQMRQAEAAARAKRRRSRGSSLRTTTGRNRNLSMEARQK